MQRALGLVTLALFLGHCGGTASLRAAEEGKLAGLSALVAADVKRGQLDAGEAVRLSRAIVRREVETATGDPGVARLRSLEGCARHVDGALERRSEKVDAVAAAAARVRLEAGLAGARDFAPWAREAPGGPRAAFRPVGARALVRSEDGALRRQLVTDGDQEVRLGALEAAALAADPADVEVVLEAARVDPFPLARTWAIRAAGAVGGERVVLALGDLWAAGDEPIREAIVDAWATPASLDAGGRHELDRVVTQGGVPAIAAASALIRAGGKLAPPPPGVADALGVLERAIHTGTARERIFAIAVAPLAVPPLRAAIVKAAADPDEEVALAAASRQLEAAADQGGAAPAERKPLIAKLMALTTSTTPLRALLAKGALARAGAREVGPLLDKDAGSTDPQTRKAAGMALVSLGELPRAAVLAADADERVRVPVACRILQAGR